MIAFVIALVISGLIIGALGRLVVPGKNPMGFLRTMLFGLAGSFLGGLVGRVIFGLRYRESFGVAFVLAVFFAALLVYFFERPRQRTR